MLVDVSRLAAMSLCQIGGHVRDGRSRKIALEDHDVGVGNGVPGAAEFPLRMGLRVCRNDSQDPERDDNCQSYKSFHKSSPYPLVEVERTHRSELIVGSAGQERIRLRSEERRVGKECRSRWSQ